jgi:hypothetical protein
MSAFTHLWNPLGFPAIRADEGIYMERALRILQGGGPQVPLEDFGRPYDHPYFSQIFLASVFGFIGYPDSVKSSADVHSAESLYLIPRILMGILAVVDTFIIYKICERRYNERVAFTAAILFAVMPLSWLTGRVYLDPIQLPFILLAVLFAVYMDKMSKNNTSNLIQVSLLSGLFLGLAIFIKIPAICMLPLVGYLVFKASSTRKSKSSRTILAVWLIPVIIIPSIWPGFAVLNGQFDKWYSDVLWQTGREGGILDTFNSILTMDPVLIMVGLFGLAYGVILKRDLFVILWVIPFVMLFSFFIGRMAITFWVPMIPAFCIAAGILIEGLTRIGTKDKISSKSKISYYLKEESSAPKKKTTSLVTYLHVLAFPIVLVAITVFGLISTLMLITINLNSSYFDLYRFIILQLPEPSDNIETLLVGSAKLRSFYWIPEYVIFDKENKFDYRASPLKDSSQNKKVILLSDRGDVESFVQSSPQEYTEHKSLYNNTRQLAQIKDKTINYDREKYPYTNMIENRGIGEISVRGN